MADSRHLQWIDPKDESIRRLKAELYESRMTIILLMPEKIQRLLSSYSSCESREHTHEWAYRVADQIVESAEVLPQEQRSYLSDRAECPLCGRGSTSPYQSGFSVPEGLRRHLVGWGDAQHCDVMREALRLARDYWQDKFHAAEELEAAATHERLEARKKTEMLYRITPDDDPCLIENGLYFDAVVRDQAQLGWAESRLADLGFSPTTEANVRSYIVERGAFVVYADPRPAGQIVFRVYKKPLPRKTRRPRIRSIRNAMFYLRDSWKNDIRGKYETRLSAAMATLG